MFVIILAIAAFMLNEIVPELTWDETVMLTATFGLLVYALCAPLGEDKPEYDDATDF
jgi:hypothetical protein